MSFDRTTIARSLAIRLIGNMQASDILTEKLTNTLMQVSDNVLKAIHDQINDVPDRMRTNAGF
jgi:F0F1-type ATP synthase membrane subunit a